MLWTCGWRREGSKRKKRRNSACRPKEKEDMSGVEEVGREKQADKLEWGLVRAAFASGP